MQTDNLSSLKDDMIAFIAGLGLRRMPAYVTEEVPSVLFEEGDSDDGWKDFVEHAKAVGALLLTMSEVALEQEDVTMVVEQLRNQLRDGSREQREQSEFDLDDAQSLTRHVGKTGYLQLGFSSGGVMYLFETSTDWYERFQDLMEAASGLGGLIPDDRDDS